MRVIAYVVRSHMGRLESCLSATHSLREAASLDMVRRELDAGHSDVGLIDLDACGEPNERLLVAITARHGPKLVVYASFTQHNVRIIVRLARYGLCHIAYRGIDDLPSSLRRMPLDAAASGLGAQILDRLSGALSRACAPVRETIVELFSDPLRFRCSADVADAAGVARRSVDRSLHAVGLEPTRTFLLAARITWAYPRIRAARARLSDVSQQLGVSKPELFSQHTRLLLGLPPSVVRTQVSPDQFVEMIVDRLQRQPRPVTRGRARDQSAAPVALPTSSWSSEHVLVS